MKSILKKILIVTVALIASLNLGSCNLYQFDEEKVGKEMESVLTQLFNSVQDGDKEKFKTFFADHVIELPNFEYGCKHIFDLYKGDLISVKFNAAGHTGKHIVPGEQIRYAYMTFLVITSQGEYRVCVEFYTKYESKYPDGLYKIIQLSFFPKQSDGNFIPRESDGNFDSDWIAFGSRHGIYYPGWNNEGTE